MLFAMSYVPAENVIGRAGMIYFSIGGGGPRKQSGIRFERIGTMVR